MRRRLRALGDRRGEKRLRPADGFVVHISEMRAPLERALGTFADQPSQVSEGGVRAPLEKLVVFKYNSRLCVSVKTLGRPRNAARRGDRYEIAVVDEGS